MWCQKPVWFFQFLYSQGSDLDQSTCLAELTENHTESYLQVMHGLLEYFSRLDIQHLDPPSSWQSDNRMESHTDQVRLSFEISKLLKGLWLKKHPKKKIKLLHIKVASAKPKATHPIFSSSIQFCFLPLKRSFLYMQMFKTIPRGFS